MNQRKIPRKCSYKEIFDTIKKHRSFVVTTHVNPDPDALSSQLALGQWLKSMGKKVWLVNEAPVPERFMFLPHARTIKSGTLKASAEVVIVVDCGVLDRIGLLQSQILPSVKIINIDHHVTNDFFGDVNLVQEGASSTCEIIYVLLHKAKFSLNRQLATLLYVGIMTDTGSFKYENTSSLTHIIAGKLYEFGIDVQGLYRRLYESVPLNDLKHFTSIINSFESYFKGKLVCVELRKKLVDRISQEFDLRDKIFRYLRTIKGVQVVVILTEISRSETRVNFRSQESVDVAQLAFKFNGGGHRRASGCMLSGSIKDAKRKIIHQIGKII